MDETTNHLDLLPSWVRADVNPDVTCLAEDGPHRCTRSVDHAGDGTDHTCACETSWPTEEILEPDFQVLANGIDEAGLTRAALAWTYFAITYIHEMGMAAAYPPFTYRNVDGFETELQLDWTGITCSSISNERAVVVFDDSEQLVELHQVLVGD